jgi:hypothetical protein
MIKVAGLKIILLAVQAWNRGKGGVEIFGSPHDSNVRWKEYIWLTINDNGFGGMG